MSISMKVYHRMPAWTQSLGASLRGYYLNSSRYDGRTEELVEEALERESWQPEQWRQWQQEQLSLLLERAATKVPYYRETWSNRRRGGDRSSWEYLENWHPVEKADLRMRGKEFIADDIRIRSMVHEHTSGTTGTSLDLWLAPKTVKLWYALFEARCRRWYGVTRRDRWAILGGQLVVPVRRRNPPFWIWNQGMKQLYLSSYHLSPENIDHYIDAIARYRISYILGYPSAIYSIARAIVRLDRKDIQLKVAITNAEPLFDFQRETISAAFNCPVRETYGMAEIVAAGSECEGGTMHQWPEVGIIEHGAAENDLDRSGFVCTGLLNADMPLIRYRVGDRGEAVPQMDCSCGRALPRLPSIDGRSDDVVFSAEGRSVGRLDPVFKAGIAVREAQIIQKTLTTFVIKYVPDPGFNEKAAKTITERLRERLGDVKVVLEEVSEIPRTNRGKFRAVICELPLAERSILLKGGTES
jgi:phenylacetate-CoA ligase